MGTPPSAARDPAQDGARAAGATVGDQGKENANMGTIRDIVPLAMEHEEALRDFLRDFAAAGETDIPAYFAPPDWSHAETVARLAGWARGEDVPEGFVPSTTSFLVEGGRILGVSNVRHWLNEHLLHHGGHVGYSVRPSARGQGHATRLLEGAKELARGMGLGRILVMCKSENTASVRVIERGGGVLEEEVFDEEVGTMVRRHWISLAE